MSEQMSLKGTAVSNLNKKQKSGKMSSQQESSYNRFFVNAFTEAEIDEIVDEGGSETEDNFEIISKKKMKQKDYWDKMFGFTGRDGIVRKSKYNTLGGAIYSNYFKDLRPIPKVVSWETKKNKVKVTRLQVPKGKTFVWGGKRYKSGSFLPKSIGGD